MKEEDHVEIYGELREELGLKTYLHGPMDYAISCRGPRPGREERVIPGVERRSKKMHRCAFVAKP